MRPARSCVLFPALAFALPLTAQQPYGHPTGGAGGFEPALSAPGPWLGNSSFGVTIRGGAGGAPGLVVLGSAPSSLPVAGFEYLIDPAAVIGSILTVLGGSQPGEGTGTVALPLPPSPVFAGVRLYSQAVIADAGAPAGVAATHGLRVDLTDAPLVFVGCSIANADPFQLIDPFAGVVVDSGAPAQVNNVTAAAFGDGGRRLWVASSIAGTVGEADATSLPATWTTIFSGGGTCYGLAYDRRRDWLWTLTNPGIGSRELTALDVAPGSPSYGQVATNTVGVASGIYERWTLSPSGRRAAVLGLTGLMGTLTIVDTDDTSPTFLQNLVNAVSVPVSQATTIALPNQVRITPDDRYALVLLQLPGATPGEIARYDIENGAFIDHDPATPAIDNLGPTSSPPIALGGAPHGFSVAQSGTFAIVSGFNACGWIGRLELDPYDPLSFQWTTWSPSTVLSNAWAATLSPDETEVGVARWASNQCTSTVTPAFVRLDSATGTVLGTTAIAANSNSSTLQNLYTVVYR